MKQISISVFIILFTLQFAQGQKINTSIDYTPQQLHDLYIQKHKTNKTVAWVMLGSGVAMGIGGIITLGNQMTEKDYWVHEKNNKGEWLFYVGAATAVLSIPFFISARNNKRKARMSLKGETITFNNDSFNKNYMAVALTFSF